ncbi:MAG TPA: 4-phosphoerythronate dehydrogenase [Verrucomicrobia bacterium]|nr:4-phosphoerythronate dehydrogenase [Verrucomicrobiota bacterium]
MRIVVDRNMPLAAEAFGTLGETLVRDGRSLTNADVRDADVLAIRSTTRVNAELLEGSRVRFVGTATIGIDHMDIAYLESKGIAWCFSPGCNANSVSEYVTAALLHLATKHGFSLEGKTMGVIGVGNVGSKVVQKARALGMKVLMNDPPRQRQAQDDGIVSDFVNIDDLLAGSDIVTLHVPMEKGGMDPTFHLADAAFFDKLRKGSIFINAARGAVVATDALLASIRSGTLAHTVLDTWEGEPGGYRDDVLGLVDLATPHIAGHSFEGKVAGTEMVYRAACKALALPATWTSDGLLPPPLVPEVQCRVGGRPCDVVLHEVVRQVYDIIADDARMRARPAGKDKAAHFDGLRKNYPMRREFRFTRVQCPDAANVLRNSLHDIGFYFCNRS